MATADGKTADGDDRWREIADGHVVLDAGEVRLVRAMLAGDRSAGKANTLRALGLETADLLDEVTVLGALPEIVEAARRRLAAWWEGR